jgi:colanic acid/amylovoran biosynthesis glycosyltransferase
VLHVTSDYGVASETFVADAIWAAEAAGWTAWLVTLRLHDAARFSHPRDERLLVAPSPPRLVRRAVNRLRRRSALEHFAAALEPRLVDARLSVVHAHFGWAAPFAVEFGKRLGLPLACTFHASDVTVWPSSPPSAGAVSPSYAQVFRRLDHAFVVSDFIANKLRAIGWRGPTEILPAGVRLDLFPERTAPPPPDPPRLLYVGRLVPRKGLDVLLRAFADLRERLPDVVLDVIGEGPHRAQYEQIAVDLVASGAVRFLGSGDRRHVLAALRRAHVLVVPSRTMPSGEVEGSPVIVKEALAVGVPVVATSSGGLPEVVPPVYRDELVPEDDETALAEQLRQVLTDDGSWRERARIGRQWVEQEFDWGVLGERTAATYARLAAGRTR